MGSFVGQTRHSGEHREDCHRPNVSRREARGGSLSHANSNFNGKMHSSNSFEFGFLADHRSSTSGPLGENGGS